MVEEEQSQDESLEEFLNRFKREYGALPEHHAMLGKYSPRVLKAYYDMRGAVMDDSPTGKLPKKMKELLAVAIMTVQGHSEGAWHHAKAAVRAGASVEEVQEAVLICLLFGGLPTYAKSGMNAVKAAEEAKADK